MAKIMTFGCRINFYESEVIRQIINDRDDYIIINSCTITHEAHRQSLQALRKARREHPQAKIIATGCAVSISPEDFLDIADIVITNNNKLNPREYMEQGKTSPLLVTGYEGRNRAFIQVQQGCNFKCTYCIVPQARGESYSIPYEDIHKEIESLSAKGIVEVILTGINLSDYKGGIANLTHQVLRDFPTLRIRYGSIDPAMVDDEIIALFKDERIMPHLHLSVQSGDNTILKRMGRRHKREKIIEISQKLREIRPEIMLGADFIAGFPTETEEHFLNTKNLIEEATLSLLHVFPYSERPNTPAIKLSPIVDKAVRKERASILRQAGEEVLLSQLEDRVGKVLKVLFETDEKGYGDEFIKVNAKGQKGNISEVLIKRVNKDTLELEGEVI